MLAYAVAPFLLFFVGKGSAGREDFVRISLDPSTSQWRLVGKMNNRTYSELLQAPAGTEFGEVREYSGAGRGDNAGVLRSGAKPVLWLTLIDKHGGTGEGVYIRCISWSHHHWHYVPQRDTPYVINQGSMMAKDGVIYAWNPDLDHGGWSRGSRHHFVLEKFRISNAHLSRFSRLRTKSEYRPWVDGNWPVKTPVPLNVDPMREFGFRWTWGHPPAVMSRDRGAATPKGFEGIAGG